VRVTVSARAGHPASRAQSNARWKVTSRPCRAPAPAAQRTPWAAGSRFAPLRALTLGLAHSRPRVQRSAGTPCQGSPRSRARASARRRRGRAARPRGAHPAAAEGHQRGQARRVHLAVRREQPQRDARRAQRGRGLDVGGHHLRARRRFSRAPQAGCPIRSARARRARRRIAGRAASRLAAGAGGAAGRPAHLALRGAVQEVAAARAHEHMQRHLRPHRGAHRLDQACAPATRVTDCASGPGALRSGRARARPHSAAPSAAVGGAGRQSPRSRRAVLACSRGATAGLSSTCVRVGAAVTAAGRDAALGKSAAELQARCAARRSCQRRFHAVHADLQLDGRGRRRRARRACCSAPARADALLQEAGRHHSKRGAGAFGAPAGAPGSVGGMKSRSPLVLSERTTWNPVASSHFASTPVKPCCPRAGPTAC